MSAGCEGCHLHVCMLQGYMDYTMNDEGEGEARIIMMMIIIRIMMMMIMHVQQME